VTPFELVTVCLLLLIFVREMGEQCKVQNQAWFLYTLIVLMSIVAIALLGALKGMF
jgi:hypothetical protein